MPAILHPRDAILRVTRSCICGSDLRLYQGWAPDTRIGSTFGHEFTGVVEEVGSAVENLVSGDHVIVPFNIACGECQFCEQGLYGDCSTSNPLASAVGGTFGHSHTVSGFQGAQAEYVRVPFADFGPTKVPFGMDLDDAVMLTDVVPTGYHAVQMGGVKPGDTVVVFGAGPVGIMAARCAWLFGAARVIVIDHVDYRLEFVRTYAPAEVYNYRSLPGPLQFLKQATDGEGADVCIDAVGGDTSADTLHASFGRNLQGSSSIALQWAINSAKKGGVVSIVGVYGPTGCVLPVGNVVNKGISIRAGQVSVKRLLPKLIEYVQGGRLSPKALITHRVPLEEISDAYHLFSRRLDGCIKPVLMPSRTRF